MSTSILSIFVVQFLGSSILIAILRDIKAEINGESQSEILPSTIENESSIKNSKYVDLDAEHGTASSIGTIDPSEGNESKSVVPSAEQPVQAVNAVSAPKYDGHIVYVSGPFDVKPGTRMELYWDDSAVIFKGSKTLFSDIQELFRIPYASVTGAAVDTAEQLGKMRTLGAYALAGPLAAVFVGFGLKKKDKLLRIDFQDETGLSVAAIFHKYESRFFSPQGIDALVGIILTRRRELLGKTANLTTNALHQNDLDKPLLSPKEDMTSLLEKIASLRDKGILTEEEFQKKKTELLSRL